MTMKFEDSTGKNRLLATQRCQYWSLDKRNNLCFLFPRMSAQVREGTFDHHSNRPLHLSNDRSLPRRCAHVGGVQRGPPPL